MLIDHRHQRAVGREVADGRRDHRASIVISARIRIRSIFIDVARELPPMLVLSRKLYETVVIDGVITISVVRIEPKVIRLAIKAPDRIMIMRGELVAPTALADVVEPIRDRPDRSGSGPGWLVLSRKLNETIVIDGEIEVTVVRIEPKVIRLAIKAPDQVKIMRGELVNRIRLAKSVAPLRKRPSSPARCGLDADPVGCDAQEVS